jgi:hypothetical protein
MKIGRFLTDEAILAELGVRLAQRRLELQDRLHFILYGILYFFIF